MIEYNQRRMHVRHGRAHRWSPHQFATCVDNRTWGGLHLIFSVEGSVYARVPHNDHKTDNARAPLSSFVPSRKVLPYALFSALQVLALKALEAW